MDVSLERLIELLRERAMVGRMTVQDKQLMLEAADRLESLDERCVEFAGILPACEGCEGKTEFGERTEKCVYNIDDGYCMDRARENYFALKARVEQYEKVVGKLVERDGEVVGVLCGKETAYVEKGVATTMKNLAVRIAVEDLVEEIKEVGKFGEPIVDYICLSFDELAELEKKYKERKNGFRETDQ